MDIFLTISGITGESTTANFTRKIQLTSCNWGLGRLNDANGMPSGQVLIKPVFVTKLVDSTTASLATRVANGTALSDPVTIQFVTTFNNSAQEMTRLDLKGARVEQHFVSGFEGGGTPVEQLMLSYTAMTVKVSRRSTSGQLLETKSFSFSMV